MSETKTVKTVLGEIEFDKKNNHYSMTADQLYAKMEEAGLVDAKKVVKAVKDAENKVLEQMANFVSDQAKKTMEDTSISAGMMPYRLEAETTIVKEVNVPGRDGAPTTRKTIYGATSAKSISKTPGFIKKSDYLHQNAEEIEKEYLKSNNKIKIVA
jgi:hypothetical protein